MIFSYIFIFLLFPAFNLNLKSVIKINELSSLLKMTSGQQVQTPKEHISDESLATTDQSFSTMDGSAHRYQIRLIEHVFDRIIKFII